MSGWLAMKRGITSHPLFKGRHDRLAIWVWLLDNAAWKDTRQDVNGRTVPVPRGSVLTSERRIASELGIGYQVVRTFLDRLATERMIKAEANAGRTLISLCNWSKYQVPQASSNAPGNAGLTQHQRTKGTREQEEGKREGAIAPSGATASEPDGFAAFWEAYPHKAGKVGRKPALAAYRRALGRGATEPAILDGARLYHFAENVKRGIVRNPSTWLNQDGWTDEITPSATVIPIQPKGRSNGASSNFSAGWAAALGDARVADRADHDPPQPLLPARH